MDYLVEVQGLRKVFHTRDSELEALSDINLKVSDRWTGSERPVPQRPQKASRQYRHDLPGIQPSDAEVCH